MACFPDVWAPKALSYFTAITSIVLCIVITCGNSIIILAVIVNPLKKLRTPFNFFLVNLAVSDLIVGTITMPVSYAVHMDETKGFIPPYKITMIHVSYFVSSTASVLSLAAISVDRFVAIKWPIRYRRNLSVRRCLLISFGVWIFSGAVSMIYLQIGYIMYLMVFAHLSVVVTFILLLATHREVYKAIRQQSNALRALQCPPTNQPNNEGSRAMNEMEYRRLRTEKKVTRAFLYILGLFVCCYVPAIIMIYILQFCEKCSCDLRHVMRDLQFILVSANSAMNPFVCTIRLGPFRRSIIAIFTCRKLQGDKYVFTGEVKRDVKGIDNPSSSSKNTESFELK